MTVYVEQQLQTMFRVQRLLDVMAIAENCEACCRAQAVWLGDAVIQG